MANKVIGYILLAVGLIVIGWTLFASYDIFTGKASAPKIFLEYTKESPTTKNTQDPQKLMEQAISNQLGNLLPTDSIPQILNLVIWSMLAGILILGGSQIASLGIRLVAIKDNSNNDK